MSKLLKIVLAVHIGISAASLQSESCETTAEENSAGSALLQARSTQTKTQSTILARPSQMPIELLSLDQKVQTKKQVPEGTARATLPPHLFDIGMQVLHTEKMLDAVVANTVVQQQVYAGVSLTVRLVTGDAVDAEDFYGLANLGQSFAAAGEMKSSESMMSMLDIGGNYGRISIATFKNFPHNLRVIAVEPVPSTYFLLRWNLWLNGVPELELQEFYNNPSKPGVLPLNHGIENVDDKVTGFCYTPPLTMGARICDCSKGWLHLPGEHCEYVVSRSVNTLIKMFNVPEITFLKMDCEGCELDVIPALMQLKASGALRIHRFAGELHAMPNELEDFACQAEGGNWFVSICIRSGGIFTDQTKDRCPQGAARESCARIPYADLMAKRPPPSEWYKAAGSDHVLVRSSNHSIVPSSEHSCESCGA